jgi:DNA ligase-1
LTFEPFGCIIALLNKDYDMNKPWTVLAKITANDSKLAKQTFLLQEAIAGNDDLFRGIRIAYDPMLTLGVKKVPESKKSGPGLAPAMFFNLCQELAERKLTGDAAQDAIGAAMALATTEEWNGWYRLVLIKDLKAGFSESTVNKVCEKDFPKYAIPVFEVQLAKDCVDDEGNVAEELLCGKKIIDVKLDGMRCITIVYPDGKVNQYSRNGKELFNFEKIKSQFATIASQLRYPMVFDGEVMSASFQDLMKQAKRKTDVQADDTVLNLFDFLPLSEFLAGKSTEKQAARTASLIYWSTNIFCDKLPNVTVVGTELVDLDTKEGKARLLEINALALLGKYEGIMLKDPEALYECKRSLNWMKMKPFIEESLTAVDVEEGKPDSKFKGTMGAIVFEGVVDSKKVKVTCGGGYSIQQRAQIWANFTGKPVTWQKKVKGKWETITEVPNGPSCVGDIGEIRADALTKSDDNDYWSMRFPRFKTWRGFAKGEKL